MKTIRFITLSTLLLVLLSGSCLASVEKANAAYEAEDYQLAFELYQAPAKQGDAKAQARLGSMYYWGRGTRASESEAYAWTLKAAKQGEAESQHMLGYLYENGIFIGKKITKAIEWYSLAAKQNHAPAQANLAGLYIYGEGVPQALDRGKRYAQQAAEQNNRHAQFLLGHTYHQQDKNYPMAIKWYQIASKNGHGEAANRLGVLHFNGEETPKDYKKAYYWFRIAEENDSAEGYNNRARAEELVELDELKKIEVDIAKWFKAIAKAKAEAEKPKKSPLEMLKKPEIE